MLATAAMAAGAFVSALRADAATPRIGMNAVLFDSPGAAVPVIVTVYGVPSGSPVTFSATGTGGSVVTCPDAVWENPVRKTVSGKCYLQMPNRAGSYNLHVTANVGGKTITGIGAKAITAAGEPSPAPITLAAIQSIERCGNTTSDVWLSFDDGGSAFQVNSILDTLKRNNVKGHFFFLGNWQRSNPSLFAQIKAAGHVIGNHTSTHPALSRMSEASIAEQIENGTAATGTPGLLRPPFGAGAFTTRLAAIAGRKGYELCRWTVDTYDWYGMSTAQMVERIRYGDYLSAPIEAGGVILMHGHGKSTAPGLQQIIDTVRAKGLRLEPLL